MNDAADGLCRGWAAEHTDNRFVQRAKEIDVAATSYNMFLGRRCEHLLMHQAEAAKDVKFRPAGLNNQKDPARTEKKNVSKKQMMLDALAGKGAGGHHWCQTSKLPANNGRIKNLTIKCQKCSLLAQQIDGWEDLARILAHPCEGEVPATISWNFHASHRLRNLGNYLVCAECGEFQSIRLSLAKAGLTKICQGHGHKTNDKVKSLFPSKHKDAQAKGSVSTPSSKKGANKFNPSFASSNFAVSAQRRKAEGKDARSTASISRSQRRAQQHHLAKAKAKPEDESSRARSRSPLRRGASSRSPAAEVAQRSPSYSEESEEESTGPGGAGARDDPLVDPLRPAAAAKATGEILPEQKYKGQRATTADQVQVKGELLPEAGRPGADTVQGGQSAGSGETLPAQRKATAQADTQGVASEPSRKRAMAEHGKLESAEDAGGGRLVDVTPLSELGQAVKAPPVEPAHTTAERTDAATASTSTTVAGPQPKTSATGIPPGGPAGVDEDEYTSESTEEVPALRGEPLTKGVRMWTPSQFPLVMTLCKDLKSGEFLPEEVQVERLGYGRTRTVYSLPSIGPYSHYGDCVLKLCLVRQRHGKEAEWGSHCIGGDHNPQGASQPGLWAGSQVCTLQHPKACCHGHGLASTMGQQPIAGA